MSSADREEDVVASRPAEAERAAAGTSDASVGPSPTELPPLPEGLYCPDCGYDLRGLTSNRCPECGFSLEPARTQAPQIPWVHRREIGRFRAYWRTVTAATIRPKRFCLEILRPVSYAEAQRFRWVTILHAYVPLLIAGAIAFVHGDLSKPWDWASLPGWLLAAVCALLELLALTGLTSYVFHPKHLPVEVQNRAVALSYYAWAHLAITPLALPLILIGLMLCRDHGDASLAFIIGALGIYGLAIIASLGTAEQYARRVLHQTWRVRAWTELRILVLAVGATVLILLLVPFSFTYLLLIVESLR